MQVTFLGGADIGATCLWFRTQQAQWLVDAGARMDEQNPLPDLAVLEREQAHIQAIFITHAHHDHIGALPTVSHMYPDAPVFMTAPTTDIARIMLQDALRLGEAEGKTALFTEAQLIALWDRVRILPQDRTLEWKDIQIATYTAGHILGAVSIGFATDEGRVLFTGDVSITPGRLIGGAHIAKGDTYDVVITESTYGARLHDSRALQERALVEQVSQVIEGGGFVLIPAFAVGRAQEVLMILLDAMAHNRSIPKFPIVVDGLVRSICPVYESYPHLLRGPAKRKLHEKGRLFPLDDVQFIRRGEERQQVLQGKPACIISSSGMLSGGPSVQYAQGIMGNEQNAVFLCGYQDEESPGRQLLRLVEQPVGERRWILPDRVVSVKGRVELYGLSAHADRRELAQLVQQVEPEAVWLVHGDDEAKQGLKRELASRVVQIPRIGDTLQVVPKTRRKPIRGLVRPGQIALCVWEDALALGVIRAVEGETVAIEQWNQTVVQAESAGVLETLGRVPAGELPGRYLLGLWEAAEASAAENRLYGYRPTERIAYHMARQRGMVVPPDATGQDWIAQKLEPYGLRKIEADRRNKQHRVFLAFPWAIPLNLRKQVEDRAWNGWPYRIEPFVHAPTLIHHVERVLQKQGVAVTVGGPQLFTDEQRIVMPVYGKMSDAVRAAVETELTQTVGGAVSLQLKASSPPSSTRVEQNDAMRAAKALLPESFHVSKVGVDPAAGILRVIVWFPDAVINTPEAKACEERIVRETGWRVEWAATTNQTQLSIVAQTCIEQAGGRVLAQPSLQPAHKAVEVRTDRIDPAWEAAKAAFHRETGWELRLRSMAAGGGQDHPVKPGAMTMHDALTWIEHEAQQRNITLYRKSWYGDRVELGFLTPELGNTYSEWLKACCKQIGVPVQVAQSVNQQALVSLVDHLLRKADIPMTAQPSVFLADKTVAVRIPGEVPAAVQEVFYEQTAGWTLRVR